MIFQLFLLKFDVFPFFWWKLETWPHEWGKRSFPHECGHISSLNQKNEEKIELKWKMPGKSLRLFILTSILHIFWRIYKRMYALSTEWRVFDEEKQLAEGKTKVGGGKTVFPSSSSFSPIGICEIYGEKNSTWSRQSTFRAVVSQKWLFFWEIWVFRPAKNEHFWNFFLKCSKI